LAPMSSAQPVKRPTAEVKAAQKPIEQGANADLSSKSVGGGEVKATQKPIEQGGTKEALPVPPVQIGDAPAKSKPKGTTDIAGLRRLWPDVIEDVKKRRRLTWSLLSTSAQILGIDDEAITIAIVNAGARDSFIRSGSDEILRQSFIDIVGLDRKIEVVVDPSINPNTPQARAVRLDESPNDADQLSGQALLAKELGASFVSETQRP